jgi:hypothetical protein
MIKLTRQMIDRTQTFQHVLPDRDNIQYWMENILEHIYERGRTWIIKQVRERTSMTKKNKTIHKIYCSYRLLKFNRHASNGNVVFH